jgi:hypothetical protein
MDRFNSDMILDGLGTGKELLLHLQLCRMECTKKEQRTASSDNYIRQKTFTHLY